ncbi:P-loop containing nucleoside triphosphate hydrolase protein [Syncephalis plumigaleata]|nr:P-loop containing nucleoside triphosphate hydrolase protein [Syncephalis plumigaleata]
MLRHSYETEIFAIDRCRDNEQLSTQDRHGQMLQHQLTAYLLATSESIRSSATLEERATAQSAAHSLLRERDITLVSRVDSLLENKREKRGFTPVLDKINYTSLSLETMLEQSCRIHDQEPTGCLATALATCEENSRRLNRSTGFSAAPITGSKDPYSVQSWNDTPIRFAGRLDPNFFKPKRKDNADGLDRKRTADQMYRHNDDSMDTSGLDHGDNNNNNNAVVRTGFTTAKEQLTKDYPKPTTTNSFRSNDTGAKRRPLNPPGSRKFIPPLLNRSGDDTDSNNYGSNTATTNNEQVDPRLRNIEPRMIEMIENEIMDQGRPILEDDIAGLKDAKQTIKEIVVWPMERPDLFQGLLGPAKGVLLFGPPGTGKTLIGKWIASESKATFFSISSSSLTSKWIGEGEKMVRALFAVARVKQPAVIFIDEIDSWENEASRRIKTEFLIQFDGCGTTKEDDRILIIGKPQEIDEAARRRFRKRLYIPLPDESGRIGIIRHLLHKQNHQLSEEEIDKICQLTQGYSGSDMDGLCREAALGPIRSITDIRTINLEQVQPIQFKDFESALTQVRASVSDNDLTLYIEWDRMYGSRRRDRS